MVHLGPLGSDDDVTESFGYGEAHRAYEEREFDLRVKMFALDMAVQAAPVLCSVTDNDEAKRYKISQAAADFEKYLRGEAG